MRSLVEITITRQSVMGSRQSLRPWRSWYYATGPDGTQWDNGSLVTLRANLRRAYPDTRVGMDVREAAT